MFYVSSTNLFVAYKWHMQSDANNNFAIENCTHKCRKQYLNQFTNY